MKRADKQLIVKINAQITKHPFEFAAYEDMFAVCRGLEETHFKDSHKYNGELRADLFHAMKRMPKGRSIDEFYDLWKKSLLFDAPFDLDCYLRYLELNRPPDKRFYQPRQKVLRKVARAMQSLADDELDELFISMPPRVGKTTMLMMLCTWLIGKNSESTNLYCAFSDTITKAFYQGVLEIINDSDTYLWHDVFPNAKLVQTNAADETINIDRKKRYASLTCRSLYGTLNGACDCDGMLISDDLIGGIEEALNKDRLVAAWSKVDNNLIPRAKESAKMLWVGTRWSMIDPAGLRMDLVENDPAYENRRVEFINLPALNEFERSNFDYEYGKGFSTEMFLQRRASFEKNNDMASWMAQFMCEPIEREGALFAPADMRYYNGVLPSGEPDRIFMAVDPAWGGGDFVAAPVCYQYGDDIYLHDVVYDNGDKRVTQPLIVKAIIDHGVQTVQFECTKMTESYKEEVEKLLKEKGRRVTLTSKAAPIDKGKGQRIFDKAPDIREHILIKEQGRRSRPYSQFIQNVFAYKITGKNKNDDAPDSLAMVMNMVYTPSRMVVAMKRPF